MEVRYGMKARTTKDLDLALPTIGSRASNRDEVIQKLRDDLQDVAAHDIGDHFAVNIAAPQQEFDAPPEGGARFPVEVRLDQRVFAKFHLDVGVGDIIVGDLEWTSGEDYLSFAGISPARFRVIPIAQQFAEKVHSYTLPRAGGSNSRVKDLVDLVLILDQSSPVPASIKAAVEATFRHRSTHEIPNILSVPSTTWDSSYTAMAQELGLTQTTTENAISHLNDYWKKVF